MAETGLRCGTRVKVLESSKLVLIRDALLLVFNKQKHVSDLKRTG